MDSRLSFTQISDSIGILSRFSVWSLPTEHAIWPLHSGKSNSKKQQPGTGIDINKKDTIKKQNNKN